MHRHSSLRGSITLLQAHTVACIRVKKFDLLYATSKLIGFTPFAKQEPLEYSRQQLAADMALGTDT